jgi:hypothetical protein
VHGIERDDAVREVEFTEQLLGGWDFVGFVRDIDVREDQTGFDLECVQHLGGLAIVEISKLRLRVFPSSATMRRVASVAASHRPAAC